MSTPQSRIEELAASFVERLVAIARDEVIEMLGGRGTSSTSTKRTATKLNGGKKTKGSKGEKRTPKSIAALQAKFLAYVVANPGQRVETAHAALGTSTKELALPIRKLIAAGTITTKGARRATKYFPAKKKAKKAK